VSAAEVRRRRRTRWAAAAAGGALLAAILVAGAPGAADEPLDPDSAAPSGLLGVVRLLEGLGVTVDQGTRPPDDPTTRVFVPRDLLGPGRRDAFLAWVAEGGTLIVSDAASPLHDLDALGSAIGDLLGASSRAPDCDLPALAAVTAVEHAGWERLAVPSGATGCFPLGDGTAWLVVESHGAGTLVVVASAAPFVNQALDRADNAVLAAALLGPATGDRLRIVPRPPVGSGERPVGEVLLELLPAGSGPFAALTLLAVLALVVWRGRRLGQPVVEALPPVLPSAELARSLADLLQRRGAPEEAAARLRRAARRDAAGLVGLPPSTPPPLLVDRVVARTGRPRWEVARALLDEPVPDDAALVGVARAAATVRRAVRRPADDPPRPPGATSPRSD
jgi:hypothetical protein